jgi:hypothetical protein
MGVEMLFKRQVLQSLNPPVYLYHKRGCVIVNFNRIQQWLHTFARINTV